MEVLVTKSPASMQHPGNNQLCMISEWKTLSFQFYSILINLHVITSLQHKLLICMCLSKLYKLNMAMFQEDVQPLYCYHYFTYFQLFLLGYLKILVHVSII